MNDNDVSGVSMTAGDRVIGWAATGSVVIVTAIAAVISYGHARELVLRYGVSGWTADAMPLTVTGSPPPARSSWWTAPGTAAAHPGTPGAC